MPGPHPAVALTRRAVRQALIAVTDHGDTTPTLRRLVVGVSGGADSLALAAALSFEAPKQGVDVVAVVVDHGLQPGSDVVAQRTATTCRERFGLVTHVRRAQVDETSAGPEADARHARYRTLRDAATECEASHIAVAHTGDDQAEQVLLGLLRGSGTRSLAGMSVINGDLLRPFLLAPPMLAGGPVMRKDTTAACVALALEPWADPHNVDPRYTRARVRSTLQRLEQELPAPTLRRSLVRTAEAARRDADLLDRLTDEALSAIAADTNSSGRPLTWPVEPLAALDPALRLRALQRIVVLAGAPTSELTSTHVLSVDGLLMRWRGQGPIDVPGHLEVVRSGGELAIRARRKTQ